MSYGAYGVQDTQQTVPSPQQPYMQDKKCVFGRHYIVLICSQSALTLFSSTHHPQQFFSTHDPNHLSLSLLNNLTFSFLAITHLLSPFTHRQVLCSFLFISANNTTSSAAGLPPSTAPGPSLLALPLNPFLWLSFFSSPYYTSQPLFP